ncbi:MAG: methyltransferase domain-containing protein [Acidobacteriota bacterium]|nr:methyltransferase domain-containing protein [Acidobacteriota bacterium]
MPKLATSDSPSPEVLRSSWEPLGRMMLDYLEGDSTAAATVVRRDGRREPFEGSDLFRSDGFPMAEELALELARGRVLDAGAGAGAHALELQRRGHQVVALDVSPSAVEVMRRRGVEDPRAGSLLDLHPKRQQERFDTLLLLMNGAGLGSTLEGLEQLLRHCHGLLRPGGSILLDGADLRRTEHPLEQRSLGRRVLDGRYFGEVHMHLEYRGLVGAPFQWLFIDHRTLRFQARRAGWVSQVLFEDDEGAYLARLTPQPGYSTGRSPGQSPRSSTGHSAGRSEV